MNALSFVQYPEFDLLFSLFGLCSLINTKADCSPCSIRLGKKYSFEVAQYQLPDLLSQKLVVFFKGSSIHGVLPSVLSHTTFYMYVYVCLFLCHRVRYVLARSSLPCHAEL